MPAPSANAADRPFPGRASSAHRPHPTARLVLAAVLAGLAAGFIGIAMAYLLEAFEWLFYGVAHGTLPERVAAAPAWRRVAAPAAAGLVAGALWWWQRATGAVVSVEAVVAEAGAPRPVGPPAPVTPATPATPAASTHAAEPAQGPTSTPTSPTPTTPASATPPPTSPPQTNPAQPASQRIGLLRPFGDAVVQVLTVGGGNSVGREGAPRLAAGAVAVRLARWLGLEPQWMALLAASAAGAGLAAMYNAPLGGAAYAVEIMMLAGTRRRGLALAAPVSVLATCVSWLHSHAEASIAMPASTLTWPTLAASLLVVVAAGLAGVAARALWAWARRHRLPDGWSLPLAIAGAGTLTGLASLWLTVLPGNGKDAFQAAVSSPVTTTAVLSLVGVVILKPVLTAATLGAGATGGLLAPSFSLGASVGAAVALGLMFAGVTVSVPAMALVGAGVTLAVTQRAPWFAAVFVWELAQGPVWTLGVLVVGCLAAGEAERAWARRQTARR
ncbi:MAG: chloride channel protein [Actinomyces urogenitalis]|nr:chloride channel protein [Actinomyces urogenitalis]MDU0864350.1 chloride channel protein [Actinomyces urogenitalis]MDU0874875.1 chloride channel protein [Actinomyces urogenitalis]MDU0972557.1 chloride channel protein [Actinomyces urogenitalis]MDU1564836.1 chloride channel protein [Actinomyces urogenitalis]MDU1640057.1 chloride channel protein [Actinomyces urogenitalis]